MHDLMKYIKSTFNYTVNVDANQFSDNAALKLWDKPFCNVYITPLLFSGLHGQEERYYSLIYKAVETLNKIMKEKVTFVIVPVSYMADVKIYWRKGTIKNSGMQFYEEGRKAGITIGICDCGGDLYTEEELYAIILHEFGHILALGHSPNKKDLMCGEWNPEVQNFSENDRFVLNLIYSIGSGAKFKDYEIYINEKIANFKNKRTLIGKNLTKDLLSIAEIKKFALISQSVKVVFPKNHGFIQASKN